MRGGREGGRKGGREGEREGGREEGRVGGRDLSTYDAITSDMTLLWQSKPTLY